MDPTNNVNENTFLGYLDEFAKDPNGTFTELVVCMGPMFSGKTTLLYKSFLKLHYYKTQQLYGKELDVLVINHSNDIREGNDTISSHNSAISGKIKCIKTDKLNCGAVIDFISQKDKALVLLIDEIQFFTDLHLFVKNVFTQFVSNNMFIGCFGLNSNFMRESMGNVGNILHYAKDVIILKGICGYCGTPSLCSYLKKNDSVVHTDIVIGGSDKYIPLCHRCYCFNI